MTTCVRPTFKLFHSTGDQKPSKRAALDDLIPLLYPQLRRMCATFLQRERQGHTLQPTALANEVYLLFAAQRNVDWQEPAQFFGLATQMMRRILINHAEAHKAAKRGPVPKISLDEAIHSPNEPDLDILALHDALTSLAIIDPEKARIVELRFFGGLSDDEIAETLEVTRRTVQRDWAKARMLLRRLLGG